MQLKHTVVTIFVMALIITGCSKKEHPQAANVAKPKPVVKKVVKMPVPKVITADDRAARKTPDGRLYYDFDGKRYWRNYDDGKYYLFNKTMYNNPAFKPH
jgi:hypothetical protein